MDGEASHESTPQQFSGPGSNLYLSQSTSIKITQVEVDFHFFSAAHNKAKQEEWKVLEGRSVYFPYPREVLPSSVHGPLSLWIHPSLSQLLVSTGHSAHRSYAWSKQPEAQKHTLGRIHEL